MSYDEMIKVIQAAKDGKEIECSFKSDKTPVWYSIYKPNFNFEAMNYRVKDECI